MEKRVRFTIDGAIYHHMHYLSYYKVVVFIDPLQGLYVISAIAILYLFYEYGYDT